VTLPIPSNVFTDGQLMTEAGLYANLFVPINIIYNNMPVQGVMAANANTDTSGFITVTHGLGFTPSLVIAINLQLTGGGAAAVIGTDTLTASTFRARLAGSSQHSPLNSPT